MPTNITESSTFTTTIQVPNNGEPATQASILGTFAQGLTNRTKYLDDARSSQASNITELYSFPASVGQFALAGTAIGLGSLVPVTALYNPFALYSISSNQITVPHNGFYEVHIKAVVTYSSTSNPFSGRILGKVGSTVFAVSDGKRFSASAADSVGSIGFGLAEITDKTTQTIKFEVEIASGSMDVLNTGTSISHVVMKCFRRF